MYITDWRYGRHYAFAGVLERDVSCNDLNCKIFSMHLVLVTAACEIKTRAWVIFQRTVPNPSNSKYDQTLTIQSDL